MSTWFIPGNSCPRRWVYKPVSIFTICFRKFLHSNRSKKRVFSSGQMATLQDIRLLTWVNNWIIKQQFIYLDLFQDHCLLMSTTIMSQTSLKIKQFCSLKNYLIIWAQTLQPINVLPWYPYSESLLWLCQCPPLPQ